MLLAVAVVVALTDEGAGLVALLERTDADELMVTTMVPDPAARLRCYAKRAELVGGVTVSSAKS